MAKVSERELGTPGGFRPSWRVGYGDIFEVDPNESTMELMWPFSTMVYDRMRRTDGQVSGVLRSMMLPILSAKWSLDTEGVPAEVVALVRSEIAMQEPGKSRQRRRKEGIVWKEHLREALLAIPYGHMPFEQVYQVSAARPDQIETGLAEIVHLRKLSPRPPRTLTEIRVARDGGLAGVSQMPVEVSPGRYVETFIPVSQLVMYCMDREGADWTGTSVLRAAYKHWMIKDALIRVGAQVVERNGMGVPDMTYDDTVEGSTRAEAERAVREFRSGATAGIVRPKGTEFQLVGVSGSLVDPIPQINLHDQAIAKGALAMFMDLGHDNGARSLGETFVDFFTTSLQAVADQIAETFTEHVIRDLVDLNWPGQDMPYPILTPGNLSEQQDVSATTIQTLAGAGVITPDGKLEDFMRTKYGLPAVDMGSRPALPAAPAAPGAPAAEVAAVLPLSEGFDPIMDKALQYTERLAVLRAQHAAGGHV